MYCFRHKNSFEGTYNPYKKNSDVFWILDNTTSYTEEDMQHIDSLPNIAIVINRDPGVQSKYFYHYKISGGQLEMLKNMQEILWKIERESVVTPSKVRTLLIEGGLVEI